MRSCPRHSTRALHTVGAKRVLLAALLAAGSGASAEPDPLLQLLAQRGVAVSAGPAGTANVGARTTAPLAAAASDLFERVQVEASEMVITAMNFVGVRYRRGGASTDVGFDCSGFTRHIYELSVGLVLPRSAEQQAKAPGFVAVARSALQPGDLVFFHTLKRAFSHVGIYIGDNRFIHSPSAGGQVRTDDMGFAYWRQRFDGARRPDKLLGAAVDPKPADAATLDAAGPAPAAPAAPAAR